MQIEWLHQNNNDNLVIFFSGWALDKHPFLPINAEEYDVIMIHSYNNSEFPKSIFSICQKYSKKALIGWSMGVYMAGLWNSIHNVDFDLTIALNGTMSPLDNKEGIPLRLFKRTGDRLTVENRTAFFENMMSGNNTYSDIFSDHKPRRDLNEQKEEIYSLIEITKGNISFDYDIALIGNQDKIFSKDNLKEHWKDRGIELNLPHFLFYYWNSWDEIIEDAYKHFEANNS